MKMLKFTAVALFALASAGIASAQTTVRITGSTAYRASTVTAIGNILNAGYTYGYIGSSLTGANQSTFVGTTKTGNLPVVIKCSWGGSSGGLQTLAQQSPVVTTTLPYIAETSPLTTTGAVLTSSTATFDSPANADVTMADTYQGSTQFIGAGYNTLVDTPVGVVPFVWIKGSSSDPAVQASLDKVTNMTPLLARALLSGGVPLSLFTGNPADASITAYALGRDEDSGTRNNTYAESNFGVFGSPVQYQPTIASGAITAIAPWPANTLLGLTFPVGHSGFGSGGTLATNLNTPVSASARDAFNGKFVLFGYAGTPDANGVNGGKNNLTWNGVAYSVAAVQEGSYTFWGYEHLDYRSTLTGNQKTVADQIATQIRTTDGAVNGPLLAGMNVTKTTEGAVVTHK